MRPIPQNLAAHLDGGATTLCRCWRLIRRDGASFGFTDHDRDLAFGGVVYAARTGLEAAEATAELGRAISLAKAPKWRRTPWRIGSIASKRVAGRAAWMPTHSAEQ